MVGKLTAPNPAVFDPDALGQIYAKGTIAGSPDVSGLAYAFLKNQQGNRQDAGAAYIKQLQEVNAMQGLLEQMGMKTDMMKTIIPQAVEAMKEGGFQLDDFPEVFRAMTGGNPQALQRVGLAPELMRANIDKKRADALHARSGAAGGPKVKYKVTPYGVDVDVTGNVPEAELKGHAEKARRVGGEHRAGTSDELLRKYRAYQDYLKSQGQ